MCVYRNLCCKTQPKLYNALKKYGWNNVSIQILIYSSNEDDLNWWEKHYIKLYNSFGENGYNLTFGGEGVRGWKMSPERLEKNRLMSLGRKHTDETKRKISEAHKGSKHTPEQNEANRQRRLGKKLSEETKRKISITSKGRPSHNKGNKLSEKTRNRMSKSRTGSKRNEKSTSEYVGVSWCSSIKKWQCKINHMKKSYSVGCFRDEINAAVAYNKKATELRGRDAKLNDIPGWQNIPQEQKLPRKSTSKYKWITFSKLTGKWRCRIETGGQRFSLGCFNTEKEAAIRCNEKMLEIFGPDAKLHIIE